MATMVGAGWENEKIATRLGITVAEVKRAKETFGLGIRRKNTDENPYHINLVDDLEEVLSTPVNAGASIEDQD